jgi:hypothetical protein
MPVQEEQLKEAIDLIKSARTAVVVLKNMLNHVDLQSGAETAEGMINDIDSFLNKNDKA